MPKDNIVSLSERIARRLADEEGFNQQMDKIGLAQRIVVAPAIEAMREIGLDDEAMAKILAHAASVLRGEAGRN